jgi:sulfur-oxidizing protein SoxY
MEERLSTTRRVILISGAAWASGAASHAFAQNSTAASEETLEQAVLKFTGGARPQTGKVTITLAKLVDNGNAVPLEVSVDSPQQAGNFVSQIAIFNERNPQREVAEFELSPDSGIAQVSTRIRLATTQKIAAVAKLSDGSWWMQTADVIVTLAACLEGEEGS